MVGTEQVLAGSHALIVIPAVLIRLSPLSFSSLPSSLSSKNSHTVPNLHFQSHLKAFFKTTESMLRFSNSFGPAPPTPFSPHRQNPASYGTSLSHRALVPFPHGCVAVFSCSGGAWQRPVHPAQALKGLRNTFAHMGFLVGFMPLSISEAAYMSGWIHR